MSRTAWRTIQAVAGLVILYFVVRSFAANWEELRNTRLEWHLRPGYLALSVLLTWAMYALLILAWRGFLLDWGQRLRFFTAARIWIVSSLGKYIPGKVWAIAGMAMMAQQAGVAAWAATASALLMQGLAVGTGVAIAGLAGTPALEARYPWIRMALWGLALASAAGVGLLVAPGISVRLLRRFARTDIKAPGVTTIILGVLANLAAWVGYGAAFWLLARGTLPDVSLSYRSALGAFAASYLAGLLALIAPGGLVVREGFMVLMLEPAIGLLPATALALASRLMLTLTEVGLAIPFLLFPRENARAAT